MCFTGERLRIVPFLVDDSSQEREIMIIFARRHNYYLRRVVTNAGRKEGACLVGC